MNGRKCGTCKHFEPAPIWRKGWCRNPLLFSPQQSHLVAEDDLDCERGMGNYWEPEYDESDEHQPDHLEVSAPTAETSANNPKRPLRTEAGQIVYTVSGSSGVGGNPPPPSSPPEGGPLWSGDDGDLDYLNGERYWTDWVRIIAPIVGVIVIVILLYLWISNFLDDGNGGAVAEGTGTPLPTLATTATPDQATGEGTLPAAGTGTIVVPTTENGEPTELPDTEGGIVEGSSVVVANTGGTGVNIRSEPNTGADIVVVALDGTAMTTTGPPVDAESFIWWPVENPDFSGWVVVDYIEIAP